MAAAAALTPRSAQAQSVPTARPLDGKVALVTGAGREIGIGRAIAVALAKEGADIVVCDINRDIDTIPYRLSRPAELEGTKSLVEAEGVRCLSREVDIRDLPALRRVVADTMAEFGRLDIVVPNAGVYSRAAITEITDAQWNAVMDVNVTGTMNTLRATAPEMIGKNSGNIIIIGSLAGRVGSGDEAGHYYASKWALIGLAKSAAIEFAKHDIKVNVVAPGLTRTGIIVSDFFYKQIAPDLEDPSEEEIKAALLKGAEQQQLLPEPWVTPDNIADAVVFLAKDTGRFTTGTQWEISHGRAAQHTG